MRLWPLVFCFAVVLACAAQGFAQQPTGPATLEGLLNTDKAQKPTAAADANATEVSPKGAAGTVARPKDGVQHPDLDKAWADYDAAIAKVADSIRAAIAEQFDAATAKGDLDAAEKWQAALEKFEKAGEVPAESETKAVLIAAVADYKKAKKELSTVYEAVVKSLTIEKKITEAKDVRGELVGLNKSEAVAPKPTEVEGKWISKHATYKISSNNATYNPKPDLLTGDENLHKGRFAFHTAEGLPGQNCVIDLGKPMTMTRIWIENRHINDRTAGLTVWLSNKEGQKGEKIWSAKEAGGEWTIKIPNAKARYITIGLPDTVRVPLHLAHVKVFGPEK